MVPSMMILDLVTMHAYVPWQQFLWMVAYCALVIGYHLLLGSSLSCHRVPQGCMFLSEKVAEVYSTLAKMQ